jgi:integrase
MSRGHLRQRSLGSWTLKYEGPRGTDGKRTTFYRTIRGSKREAAAELARLQAAVADNQHVAPNRLTVAAFLEERMRHWVATKQISARTAQGYSQLINTHIVPHIGARPVQRLGTRDVESWHTILLTSGRHDGKGGLNPRTAGHAHRVLSKALADGVRHGLLTKNIAAIQKAPRLDAEEMQILSPAAVDNLPAQLSGHELEAIVLVGLFCGLRRGEILALREKNWDQNEERIQVRETLEETRSGLRFKPPKTKAGIRDVSLPAIVTDALVVHRKRVLERRLMLGLGKLSGEDLIFPNALGQPRSPNAVSAAWSKLAQELGLEGVSFHGLRHTHASMLIAHGVDVVTISKRLGHASPTITLQTYSHLFRPGDGKAAAAINAALGG